MLKEKLNELVSACFTGIWIETHESHEDSDALRQQIATRMSAVQASLDGLMIDRPRRNILRKAR